MIALCGIAKYENDYIAEWVRHHLALGFDHVFIYDNNPPDYEPVGDRLQEFKEHVTIIPMSKIPANGWQEYAYTDCYRNYGSDFDWMAFFDIDEFLVLNDKISLKKRLMNITAENVLIPWKVYTWSRKIKRDVRNPVVSDFTEFTEKDCDIVKSILKTNIASVLKNGVNVHGQYHAQTYSDIEGNVLVPTVPHGKKKGIMTRTCFSQFSNFGGCRVAELNHYWSKSLDEFIKFKLGRMINTGRNNAVKLIYKYCKTDDERNFIAWYLQKQMAVK